MWNAPSLQYHFFSVFGRVLRGQRSVHSYVQVIEAELHHVFVSRLGIQDWNTLTQPRRGQRRG
jgi:hypothetical protein